MAEFNPYYSGNAGIGEGSTTAIPAENANLNAINETGRNIQLLDHDDNLNIFHQKIKDRDTLYKMLDEDKVVIGKMLDKDRKVVTDAQKAAHDAYYEMVKGGGMTNREGMRKYKDTLDNLNNVATQAQARYKNVTEEKGEIGKELYPLVQEERQKNLDDYDKKGFWADWTPYQQTANLDLPAINAYAVRAPFAYNVDEKNKQTPDGRYKVKGDVFDYSQTYKKSRDAYLPGTKGFFDQRELLKKIEALPDAEKARTIIGMNGQIDKHNHEKGLVEGMPGFAPNVTVAPNGKIADNPPDFSAKWALANQANFKTQTSELDKITAAQKLKEQEEKDKMKIAADNLNFKWAQLREAKRKNNAYIASLPKEEQEGAVSDQFTRSLVEQPGTLQLNFDGKKLVSKIPVESSLPYYTIKDGKVTDIKPFDATPIYQYPEGKSKTDKTKGKVIGYSGGYLKYNYISPTNNKPVPQADISQAFVKYKKSTPDGTFTDFIKGSVEKGYLDYSVEGANGSTDRKLFVAAQKKVANASQKKGQEGIFDDETEIETGNE